MPIEHQSTILRKHLKAKPEVLFVYGEAAALDEPILRARECRGEPNAVPILVRHHGSFEVDAYYTDAVLEDIKPSIQEAFRMMATHVERGGVVCFPSNGVGADLGAGLRDRAPAIDAYITKCYRYLISLDVKAYNERCAAKAAAEAQS